MTGIQDFNQLMKSMNPELVDGEFVFCSISDKQPYNLKIKPLMTFREEEGITLILQRKDADSNFIKYNGIWASILKVRNI